MSVEYKMQWSEITKFVVDKSFVYLHSSYIHLNENAFQSETIDEEPPYIV